MAVCEGVKLWHKTKEKKVGGGRGLPCWSSENCVSRAGGMGSIPGEGTKILHAKEGKVGGKKEKWHFADSTLVSGRCRLGTQDSGCVLTPELGTITNQKEHKLCSSMLSMLPITN